MKQAVFSVGAVVIRHDTVLLIRHHSGPKKGVWSIPVVALTVGETMQQQLARYLAETTGMVVEGGRPVYSEERIDRGDGGELLGHRVTVFLAGRYLSGNPAAAGDAEAVAWVSVEAMEFMEIDEEALLLLEALAFLELESDDE